MRLVVAGTLVVAGLLGALAPASVDGSSGVSVDLGRIDINAALAPGGEYELPTIGVTDPGSEAAEYQMTVRYVDGDRRHHPPAQWFRFSAAAFPLGPGQTRPIKVVLALPPDATPGDYQALLSAELAPAGSGAMVGAAAAARVTFSIAPSSTFDAWVRSIMRVVADGILWVSLAIVLLVAAIALRQLRRRFRIRIERRS